MNYQALFKDEDTLSGRDFRCVFFRSGGEVEFRGDVRYPMLFVLQGLLELHFKAHELWPLSAGEMIVIDRSNLISCYCKANTIILEYTPPKRLSDYFDRGRTAFGSVCSSVVPILAPMKEWIENLLKERLVDSDKSISVCVQHRKALAQTLLRYPRSLIGELYVPFYACARGACEECMREVVAEEAEAAL